ncbi:Transcription factor Tfb4 [Gracilaria domingensis]|nr:Transcription factor Tfb4 [Gracilaria domingensis]
MREATDPFRVKAADDAQDLLILILDTSVRSWLEVSGKDPKEALCISVQALKSVTEQLLVFLNTFLLLHEANRVCVIFSGSDASGLVYPVFPEPDTLTPDYDESVEDASFDALRGYSSHQHIAADPQQMVQDVKRAVEEGIAASLRGQEDPDVCKKYSCISSALATALCLLNRARRIQIERAAMSLGQDRDRLEIVEQSVHFNGRILCVLAGPDAPDQYVSVMNCIFSAQRLGVPIDSCVLLNEKDSTYFQQAAHLTNGVYVRPDEFSTDTPDTLLQYLQTVFIVDKQSRDFLAMPVPDKVDFRASCMETSEIIDNGFTCSICLSTFSPSVGKGAAMCPVCNARFAIVNPLRRPPRP